MATSMPSPLLSLPTTTQVPISPPPEYSIFPKLHPLLSPQVLRTFTPEGSRILESICHKDEPTPRLPASIPDDKAAPTSDTKPGVGNPPPFPVRDSGNTTLDPQYLAMVSRVAAFYQQQCRAAAELQNQKCQQWATAHRAKLQEMTRAATLVVAWYIRDRIQRRRKKNRRRFRRGLSSKCGRDGITKGEVVRKWISGVAEQPLPSEDPSRGVGADFDEETFDVDGETASDGDEKLLREANNVINSQLARAQLPVLGMVNFDASDTESESDNDGMESGSVGGQSESDDGPFDGEDDEGEDLERYEEVGPFHCEEFVP